MSFRPRLFALVMACATLALLGVIIGRLAAAGTGDDLPIEPIRITETPTPSPPDDGPSPKAPQQIVPPPQPVGGDDGADDDDGDDDGDDGNDD